MGPGLVSRPLNGCPIKLHLVSRLSLPSALYHLASSHAPMTLCITKRRSGSNGARRPRTKIMNRYKPSLCGVIFRRHLTEWLKNINIKQEKPRFIRRLNSTQLLPVSAHRSSPLTKTSAATSVGWKEQSPSVWPCQWSQCIGEISLCTLQVLLETRLLVVPLVIGLLTKLIMMMGASLTIACY